MGRSRKEQNGEHQKPKRFRANLDNMSEEEKKQRRKDKNCEAARRSRQKKEDKYEECRAELEDLKIRYEKLEAQSQARIKELEQSRGPCPSCNYNGQVLIEQCERPYAPDHPAREVTSSGMVTPDYSEVGSMSAVDSMLQATISGQAMMDTSTATSWDQSMDDGSLAINDDEVVKSVEINTFIVNSMKLRLHHLTSHVPQKASLPFILLIIQMAASLLYHRYLIANTTQTPSVVHHRLVAASEARDQAVRNPHAKLEGLHNPPFLDKGQSLQPPWLDHDHLATHIVSCEH